MLVGFAVLPGFIRKWLGAQGPKLRIVALNCSSRSLGEVSVFAHASFRVNLTASSLLYSVTLPYNLGARGSAAQFNCSVSSMPATTVEPIWSLVEGRHGG